jgi:hypothetical protein
MTEKLADRCLRSSITDPSKRLMVVESSTGSSNLVFVICGSTGNLYRVTIGDTCTCTCPDAWRTDEGVKFCKHLIFVKTSVFRIPPRHEMVRRVGYCDWELEYLRRHATVGARAPSIILDAYNQRTAIPVAPMVDPSASCPICYEDLGISGSGFAICLTGCRAALHSECLTSLRAHTNPVLCPCCRTPWTDVQGADVGVVRKGDFDNVKHLRPVTPKTPKPRQQRQRRGSISASGPGASFDL